MLIPFKFVEFFTQQSFQFPPIDIVFLRGAFTNGNKPKFILAEKPVENVFCNDSEEYTPEDNTEYQSEEEENDYAEQETPLDNNVPTEWFIFNANLVDKNPKDNKQTILYNADFDEEVLRSNCDGFASFMLETEWVYIPRKRSVGDNYVVTWREIPNENNPLVQMTIDYLDNNGQLIKQIGIASGISALSPDFKKLYNKHKNDPNASVLPVLCVKYQKNKFEIVDVDYKDIAVAHQKEI